MIKKIIAGIVALTIFIASNVYSFKVGTGNGVDMYHQQCYNVGGYIIDELGQVVQCAPLTQIPEVERPNFKNNT